MTPPHSLIRALKSIALPALAVIIMSALVLAILSRHDGTWRLPAAEILTRWQILTVVTSGLVVGQLIVVLIKDALRERGLDTRASANDDPAQTPWNRWALISSIPYFLAVIMCLPPALFMILIWHKQLEDSWSLAFKIAGIYSAALGIGLITTLIFARSDVTCTPNANAPPGNRDPTPDLSPSPPVTRSFSEG